MISVCMATYNGERFIKQQIDSILSQLSSDDELIISDDGSTDGTLEIIASYNDKRIKLFKHDKQIIKTKYSRNNIYVTKNFENALNHCSGDFIFLSDQDDECLPNKYTELLKLLEKNDVVMCNYSIIDQNNNEIISSNYNSSYYLHSSFIKDLLHPKFLGCCMGIRKEALSYILPFPSRLVAHDFWIGLLSLKMNKFCFTENVLHKYRRHMGNVCFDEKTNSNPFFYKIFYRIQLLNQILNRVNTISN